MLAPGIGGDIVELLEGNLEWHPLVGDAIDRPARGDEVDPSFDPDMLETNRDNAATGDDAGGGNTALLHEFHRHLRRRDVAEPVLDLVDRQLDDALGVAGGHAGGAQQGQGETGDVEGVATTAQQGLVGTLHRAEGRMEFDVIVDPVAYRHRVATQGLGQGLDRRCELGVRCFCQFAGSGRIGDRIGRKRALGLGFLRGCHIIESGERGR